MKKLLNLCLFAALIFVAGCYTTYQETPYDRTSAADEYEKFLSKHIFAACQNAGQPYALYSLANLKKTPSNDDPHYKVHFVNGPCKGQTVWTTQVILKTAPVGSETLPNGTVVLRNYYNPKKSFDQEQTDRWHVGIVSNNKRTNQNIVDLVFPRDRNDFNPARESIYLRNVRYIVSPEIKDVRTFIR